MLDININSTTIRLIWQYQCLLNVFDSSMIVQKMQGKFVAA
ncbi:uncharacterized protein METZ01_LOCUS459076 [marine metagenome]|uniref:Uncharacterized protein n=1 Tax=marine metagenome TaxID=408172 RepID=A0A383AES1_9ZZZZ